MEERKNSLGTWIVFIIVFVFVFGLSYELFSGRSLGNLFENKSERCKLEAQERVASLRDSKLEGLKLKENPTPQDLEEIERLEIQKKTRLVDREDYDYLYQHCMK